MRTELVTQNLLPALARGSHLVMPVAVVCIIGVMIIPMPTMLLDLLISLDIMLSVIVLMTSMYISQPVHFSVFPSLLLVVTLFRLSLNIAATRLILLHGNEGVSAAGHVIESFGQFVIGGNYVIGIVMFLVLLAIQYIVINHGATRIAEVTARFTLDAMPGKQMSIDADLNSGLITEAEAKARRKLLQRESEFYGAMDGAIKFTQRDAVASLIITGINIFAGIIIGLVQHNMELLEALQTFTVLTIGDGLVTAIPALLISVSGGLITTRAASDSNLGEDVSRQLLLNPRPVAIGACVLFGFGLIPGLPKLAFFVLAGLTGVIAYVSHVRDQHASAEAEREKVDQARKSLPQERIEALLKVDSLSIEVGYGLISLVDASQGGDFLNRVKSIRRQLAIELGLIVPPIHITDNLQLHPKEYSILLKGVGIAGGELNVDSLLAINGGGVRETLQGLTTKEPTFGLPAVWVRPQEKDRAQLAGYTVVDPTTVLATHLSEVIKSHAHELLGRQETKALLDHLSESHGKLVEETVPKVVSLGEVQKVLHNLLRERVSIRDMATILETLADFGLMTKDPDLLTEYVRQALSRTICRPLLNEGNELLVLTLSPEIEQTLAKGLTHTEKGSYLILEPKTIHDVLQTIQRTLQGSVAHSKMILLSSPNIRIHLRRILERAMPHLVVLSHNEIPGNVKVISMGMIN
ncbi:MAG: flagellar biosynthesis protein FlhA [Acidobacteriota bacterium]